MSTRSSVRLTSSTVFDLRILYVESCLIRILIKNSQKNIMLNMVIFFLDIGYVWISICPCNHILFLQFLLQSSYILNAKPVHINRIFNFINFISGLFPLTSGGRGGGGHQKVSYKHNVRTTILRSRSLSAQSWVMLWTLHFIVRCFVVVLGGVVFRFPNNIEKNLNKSFRKSYFLTFW